MLGAEILRISQAYTSGVALLPEFFLDVEEFQWDEGNSAKSWARHGVTQTEAEQIFLNRPVVVAGDLAHSGDERRHVIYGRTDGGRLLTVIFAVRENLARVISARPMSRREIRGYEEATRS